MSRVIPAILLVLEGLSTALWVAGLVATIGVYGPVALLLIAVRGLTGAMLFSGGWLLLSGRQAAPAIATAALLVSAALMVLEVGFRLAPTNLDPTFRWPLVMFYAVYALALSWWIRRQANS